MIKTGERRLPAPSEKVQFPGMAAGWRHGPPQALPESPREGSQLVPGLLCLAFCGGSGKPPLEGHSVLVFSAAGNLRSFRFNRRFRSSRGRAGYAWRTQGPAGPRWPLGAHSPPREADVDTIALFTMNRKKAGQFFAFLKKC